MCLDGREGGDWENCAGFKKGFLYGCAAARVLDVQLHVFAGGILLCYVATTSNNDVLELAYEKSFVWKTKSALEREKGLISCEVESNLD